MSSSLIPTLLVAPKEKVNILIPAASSSNLLLSLSKLYKPSICIFVTQKLC